MSMRFTSKLNAVRHNSTPVFNKRAFKAQAGIVLTDEVVCILNSSPADRRSRADLYKLKSVVNGLKEIHKGFQFIKDALSFVVGYEKFGPNVEVKKRPFECDLSCYYILTGSIEASYTINEINQRKKRSESHSKRGIKDGTKIPPSEGCVITYTHVAGDYLGLVSGDGEEYDLPPPYSIKTLEVCEFLRIDRKEFHRAVRTVHNQYVQEVEHFIKHESILRHLHEKERDKLVPLMAKQDYGAGKVIINQGDVPDHIFFIGKGRCQFFRRVFIKEANRLELVKLGQIEKGEVFGESSVLDGSQCFCSVASVGQVTCFLINKWVIKTNEHVLNLLREHRHQFYEDEMIKHFIRDSDIWHSYKRSKIVELLEATNKQSIAVDVHDVLGTAIDFGNAKRLHSGQATKQRELGEPEPKEPLFIVPRSRRRSSAILQSNAAAVVKAVLLLRRNADEDEPPIQSLPAINTRSPKIKPISAPSRYRSRTKAPSNSTKDYRSPLKNSDQNRRHENKFTNSRPYSVNVIERHPPNERTRPRSRGRSRDNSATKIKTRNTESQVKEEKWKDQKSTTLSKDISTTETIQTSGLVDVKSHNEQGIEKCVSSSRNFIVKEIINTGSPGRQSLPPGYQRFDKSMFSILDTEEGDPKTRTTKSPWGVTFAASKWMSGIRKRRMRKEADGMTPSPTPPPLIVIEEYAPQHILSDDQSLDDDSPCKMMATGRTPTPLLEKLQEEKDEDIAEYNKLEAGTPVEEKWYTPIHEARDESKSCLERLKTDLELFKNDRLKRKGSDDVQEGPAQPDDLCRVVETPDKATNEQQTKIIDDVSKSSHKKLSIRSRTLSMSAAAESKTANSGNTRKHSRNQRHLYSSLQLNDTITTSATRMNNIRTASKNRHEKRRLLLLEKVGF